MLLVFGATGIFTPIIEGAATAIGAGVVVGGFVGASAGVLNGWSRRQVEADALRISYIGSAAVLALWFLDQCVVYATAL
jgi:hypothetical protein